MTAARQLVFRNEYLNQYMAMVEETESPRIYHVWGAIAAVAATMGRRCFFRWGTGEKFANHYIVMVGNPSTRKSSALRIPAKLVRKNTGIKFAPDDTAGQRQGLISAMLRDSSKTNDTYLNGKKLVIDDGPAFADLSLLDIASLSTESDDQDLVLAQKIDQQHLFSASQEFSRFIGENASQLLDFLTSSWDGDPYIYQTKTEQTILKNPLLNIFGVTTPSSLARALPKNAGNQGILSRVILVYGSKKYKSIPSPVDLPDAEKFWVNERIADIYNTMEGEFAETDEARNYREELYTYQPQIADTRFSYYCDRRYDHLIKLALVLAGSRLSKEISLEDYQEAHKILCATEIGMPDALGEFGMHPLAILKQQILEFMKEAGTMPIQDLRSFFYRDSTTKDFKEALGELVSANQLKLHTTGAGVTLITTLLTKHKTEDDMINLLSQGADND